MLWEIFMKDHCYFMFRKYTRYYFMCSALHLLTRRCSTYIKYNFTLCIISIDIRTLTLTHSIRRKPVGEVMMKWKVGWSGPQETVPPVCFCPSSPWLSQKPRPVRHDKVASTMRLDKASDRQDTTVLGHAWRVIFQQWWYVLQNKFQFL